MKKLILILFAFIAISTQAQKYYLIENDSIVSDKIPSTWESNGVRYYQNYRQAPDSILYADGWRTSVIPEYDSETQYIDSIYFDSELDHVTWVVYDKSDSVLLIEAKQRLEALNNQWDISDIKEVLQILLESVNLDSVTDSQASSVTTVYDQYDKFSHPYSIGDRFVSDSILYQVVIPFTSQQDWTISDLSALIDPIRNTSSNNPDEWVQPDSTNPYSAGDTVTHNGSTWVSNIDGNVWEPGVYGWTEQ